MKDFANLIKQLDSSNKTTLKVQVLTDYFRKASPEDKVWTIAILSHRRPPRPVNTTLLRTWANELANIPMWLFEESYHIVGDLAETIALVIPESSQISEKSLSAYLQEIIELKKKTEEEKKKYLHDNWLALNYYERFVFTKLITGSFRIGDTLTGGEKISFKGVPSFSPEHFRYINNDDPLKAKQLAKGIDQLMDEGVAQLFTLEMNNRKIIGTVGALQYEVIQYRLEHEYGAKCNYEPLSIHKACWIEADEKSEEFKEFARLKQRFMAKDKYGQPVFLADSSFTIHMTQEKFPNVKLHFISEFKNAQ